MKKPVKSEKARVVEHRDHPYREDSVIRAAFDKCATEQGCKVNTLKKFLEANDTQFWVISFLRKGEGNGFKWKVTDDRENGVLKLGQPKYIGTGTAKAA